MTLQEVLTILNFNPLFKDSTDNFKITAINQALNEFQVSEVLYDTDAPKFNLRIEKYENQSHKELQKILETDYTEEEILALFKYSLIDLTLEKAFDAVIKDYSSYFLEEVTLEFSTYTGVKTSEPEIIIVNPPIDPLMPDNGKGTDNLYLSLKATFRITTPKSSESLIGFNTQPAYNIWDGTQSSTLTLGYSATYLIF